MLDPLALALSGTTVHRLETRFSNRPTPSRAPVAPRRGRARRLHAPSARPRLATPIAAQC
jgi:hypothetical protein